MPYTEITREYLFSSLAHLTGIEPSSHQRYLTLKPQIPEDHSEFWIVCGKCGEPKKIIPNCGSRTCIYCRDKTITKTLARKNMQKRKAENVRFMTLTLKSLPNLDRRTTDIVRGYFRKLIRRKGWKKYVTGGLYVIEVTRTNQGYHYHFHVLYQGKYFPYPELQYLWKKITGESYIVWLSSISDASGAFNYLLDYVGKVEKGNIKREDYDRAFKGIKLVQFFGTWTKIKGIKLSCKCKKCKESDWLMPWEYKWDFKDHYIAQGGGDTS